MPCHGANRCPRQRAGKVRLLLLPSAIDQRLDLCEHIPDVALEFLAFRQ